METGDKEQNLSRQNSVGRMLIPAIIIGTMAINVSTSLMQLFLLDISDTFHVEVGIASQVATTNHLGELVAALLMGFLVVRFRYKPLIIVGMLAVLASAVGSFFSPDFITLQIFFGIEGLGTVIFFVMSRTVIGDAYTPQKRAKAISYLMASMFGMTLISLPLSGVIADIAGWRANFILLMLPVTLIGLALAYFFVPSTLSKTTEAAKKPMIIESFKQIFTDRSATACLLSQLLAAAGSMVSVFGSTMFRDKFGLSLDYTVLTAMISSSVFVVGCLLGGRLTNRFGAKPTTAISTLLCGAFSVIYFNFPNIWGAFVFSYLASWFAAIGVTSYNCLALAQVPKSRGTMMSLNGVVEALGTTIGPAIGGALLVFSAGQYGALGYALGGMFLASALFRFIVKESTNTR